MKAIAYMGLVLNILGVLVGSVRTFTDDKINDRIASFASIIPKMFLVYFFVTYLKTI